MNVFHSNKLTKIRHLANFRKISWFLLLLWSGYAFAQAPGRVVEISVHSAALENNLVGDSPDRQVFVYLPSTYDSNPDKRYPVVYMLHGYGLRADGWMRIFSIEDAINRAMAEGKTREMIVVSPSSYNFYDGAFYTSSQTTGDWDRFISEELVAWIDSHYRTLASRDSRGLMGHSMGGYGTLRIGMKHPEVYAALYPMAACCMADAGEPGEAMALAETYRTREDVDALRYPAKSTIARAAAWSPNPNRPPLYFDLPVENGVVRPEIQAKWLANSIFPMLDQYTHNLRMYKAIKFDVGTEDGLLATNRALDEKLTEIGIPHIFETFEGDHNSGVNMRIRTSALPFFSEHLKFE
jgi:enterochelin esterase-like enzyme